MDSKSYPNAGSDPIIAAALLLHRREQDQGANLKHVTNAQKALWVFYQQQQARAGAELGQAAFLTGFIQECSSQISFLVDGVNKNLSENDLLGIGEKVYVLDKMAKEAVEKLGALNYG